MALKKDVKKYCNNCNELLVEGAMFCSKCGTKVEEEKKCQACGTKLGSEAVFCHICGVKCGEVQQTTPNNNWQFDFKNENNQIVFDTQTTNIEFASDANNVDCGKAVKVETDKPDLVAENAMLSPCPETECTHTREYYKNRKFEGTHFTRSLYNHRLYWVMEDGYGDESGVKCSKEDGTEEFLFLSLSKREIGIDDWNHIVVNYYGIFVYRLEYANEAETVKHKSQIRWYGFDGTLKQEIAIVGDKHCLSDLYIYGSKIFFVAYTGKVRRNYCVGYYDILTGEKNQIDTPKKEITQIIGNSECMMFRFDDAENEDIWYIHPYKTREQGKCYSQIEFFDLKNNRVWVNDNKLIDSYNQNGDKATTLIEYELCGSNVVKLINARSWLYVRSFGRKMEYFDGRHFYRAQEYYKFSSYNEKGEEYRWNAESKHGAYDKNIVLGDYIYFDESNWIDQYKATHIQEAKIRQV